VVGYFHWPSGASMIKCYYGYTNEGRPLMIAIVACLRMNKGSTPSDSTISASPDYQ
jgi:hypothetical protein